MKKQSVKYKYLKNGINHSDERMPKQIFAL